jgi:heme exporter protein D
MAAPEGEMNWHNMHDFLAMGGYGPYVWGSFSVVCALMAIEVWALARRERKAQASLVQQQSGGTA